MAAPKMMMTYLGVFFIVGALIAAAYLLGGGGGAAIVAPEQVVVVTREQAGTTGGATPSQPIPAFAGCDRTQSQKVGASATDLDTGASALATLNYSIAGAGWFAVSGSSTDSRNQQFDIDGLMNASPSTYFNARITGTTPCEADATAWLSRRLAQNSSAAVSIINDNELTANAVGSEEAIGSGGAATFTVTLKLDKSNAYFTNPDFANFKGLDGLSITPYYIASSNMSTSIWDKTEASLTCLTPNCVVGAKSYSTINSDSLQTVVWKVEGNLHGAGDKAKFALHVKAKDGTDPGIANNMSIEFHPVWWYKEIDTLNTINYGIEDANGNAVGAKMFNRIYVS